MAFGLLRSLTALLPLAALAAAAANNTVYIISNAETPSLNLPGLTPIGLQRAQDCLPSLLGPLNIGKIISCPVDEEDNLCGETVATATPTANALGLTIDTSCGADEETDDDCVTKLINQFGKNSTQAVLIVWDVNAMDDLFENLDIDDDNEDDDDNDDDDDDDDGAAHFDVITTIVKKKVQSTASQSCSGIDGQAPGTFRKRSLIPAETSAKKRHLKSRITGVY
ncbi:hypothetical protein BXZ70DRAFT_1013250 [Cristinia sonorae]|uniref:Uncharacterized protein n=1 Tax=Cristinia sonorae TaxID=1940300 RepID=A0A8K0XK00_9AGAR|nr:hypothetical protein BXZ70DRAFT_1013250 [Cristinia sonorae]